MIQILTHHLAVTGLKEIQKLIHSHGSLFFSSSTVRYVVNDGL